MQVNKYHAQRVFKHGRWFASKYEEQVYCSLLACQQAGKIRQLRCQVKFLFKVNGVYVGFYKADFTYEDEQGVYHVVDAKGYRKNPTYRLKKRLFEALYPYTIEEV